MSFHVTFHKFFGLVGRKKKFLHGIFLHAIFLIPLVHFAQWAHMHHFLTVCLSGPDQNSDWTIIHILESIAVRTAKLYHIIDRECMEEKYTVMKQLDVDVSPPAFVWNLYLTLANVTFDLEPWDP